MMVYDKKSLDRYAVILMECSNFNGKLNKLEKEMGISVTQLTIENQKLFKDTLFEARILVQEVFSHVISRNLHKEIEEESFFQKQKTNLQKLDYELVHELMRIRSLVLD